MFLEESMDILAALKQEEVKLQRQLKGIQGAILALNGWAKFRAEKAKRAK
jgi:hypothetical protein